MRTLLVVLMLILLILAIPPPIKGSEDRDVEIVRWPGFIAAVMGSETCFDIRVRIRPDSRNRILYAELMEGDFVRRGMRDNLQGEDSKRLFDFRFCLVLSGEPEFLMVARLVRNDNSQVHDSKIITVAGAE